MPPSPGEDLLASARSGDLHVGRPARGTVEVRRGMASTPARRRDGSDADAIGSWAERGLLGTQLGPNRNGAAPS